MRILWLAILVSGLSGCFSGGGGGGSGGSYHPNGNKQSVTSYVGTWTWQSGNQSTSCSNGSMGKGVPSGQLVVSDAGDGRVAIAMGSGCTIHFNVEGALATLEGGQQCESNGTTVTFESGSLRPGEEQLAFALVYEMNAMLNGSPEMCAFDLTGVLHK